jgi:hypothetical protein
MQQTLINQLEPCQKATSKLLILHKAREVNQHVIQHTQLFTRLTHKDHSAQLLAQIKADPFNTPHAQSLRFLFEMIPNNQKVKEAMDAHLLALASELELAVKDQLDHKLPLFR